MQTDKPTTVKKPATSKRSTPAKKPTTSKRSTPAKKPTTSKRSTPAKKPTASKRSTSAEKLTVSKRSTPAKKPTTSTRSTSAKKPTTLKRSTSAKKPRISKKLSQSIWDYIQSLRPIDDEFSFILCRDNRELVDHICDTVINHSGILHVSNIKTDSVQVQHEIRVPGEHLVRLDVYAKEANKRLFNIEFQRDSDGANILRSRDHLLVSNPTAKAGGL